MVVAANVRRTYLEKLRAEKTPKYTKLIYYKNERKALGVYEIDPNYLVFNRHNGRLESEMATLHAEKGIDIETYTDEVETVIQDFLWNTNTSRNKQTLEDIKEKGQLNPGIVTLDGVIIDGNRRAMLLRQLNRGTDNRKFDAVILDDAYDESKTDIVILETQYQMGEDEKLDYGPLEKYLKVKRMITELDIGIEKTAKLMNRTDGDIKKLLRIMELMDEYLVHIGSPGLYKLLRDSDGTKEGMFVDLYLDLKRFEGQTSAADWVYDRDLDLTVLKTIHFDFIRFGDEMIGTEKLYRHISHGGAGGNSFFAKNKIWKEFSSQHRKEINPLTKDSGDLDAYVKKHPDLSRTEAARLRDTDWKKSVNSKIKENFGKSRNKLENELGREHPTTLLEKARDALSAIDYATPEFVERKENLILVKEINNITFKMKQKFERQPAPAQ